MAEELLVEVDRAGVRTTMAAKRWGSEEGEPWLLIHGWMDNASSFDLLAPALLERMPSGAQLVCVDLIGHGHSSHRPGGVYYLVDYVADAFLFVEALGWKNFSVLGHSLGQSVASVLSSTLKGRITRLVMLEGLGPTTDPSYAVPSGLEKSLKQMLTVPPPKKIYASAEEATQRRMAGNVVGPLPRLAASILVSRGTVPVKEAPPPARTLLSESDSFKVWRLEPSQDPPVTKEGQAESAIPVIWSFDDALKLPSRLKLTEPVLQSFLARIECPVLLILTKDGLFSHYGAKPTMITTFRGRTLFRWLYYAVWLSSCMPLLGRRLLPFLSKVRAAHELAARFTAIRKLRCVVTPSGGHHPHLQEDQVDRIASEIAQWSI